MSDKAEQIDLDFGSNATIDVSGSGLDTITLDQDWLNSATITLPSSASYSVSGVQGSTISWNSDYAISGYNYTTSANVVIDKNGLEIKEGADIKVGGKSLIEAIEKIEERLAILKPNPDLEDRWEELKELRRKYQELEQDLIEKEKMWKILKEK